jgi:hypothetical protein
VQVAHKETRVKTRVLYTKTRECAQLGSLGVVEKTRRGIILGIFITLRIKSI